MKCRGKYQTIISRSIFVGQKGMTRSVGSFYKKNLLTQGAEKANQVLKRQKAIAAVEAVTKKQTANQLGRNLSV